MLLPSIRSQRGLNKIAKTLEGSAGLSKETKTRRRIPESKRAADITHRLKSNKEASAPRTCCSTEKVSPSSPKSPCWVGKREGRERERERERGGRREEKRIRLRVSQEKSDALLKGRVIRRTQDNKLHVVHRGKTEKSKQAKWTS